MDNFQKKLFKMLDNKFINNAHVAQKLFDNKTQKQASSLLYQKRNGMSSLTNEDTFKLYEILKEEINNIEYIRKGIKATKKYHYTIQ